MVLSAALTALLFLSPNSYGVDLGFRYKNGKCVNDQGQEGLNRGYFGQCADFRHLELENLDLRDLDLSGSSFESSSLRRLKFYNSILTGVNFDQAYLDEPKWRGAMVSRTSFRTAKIMDWNSDDAVMSDVDFAGQKLARSDFQGECTRCNFEGAELGASVFIGGNYSDSNFNGAKLFSARLNDGDFSRAHFDGAVFSQGFAIKAELTGTKMTAVSGKGAMFDNLSIYRADFSGADFSGAHFRNVIFDKVNFNKANLSGADFGNAQFKECTVDQANFQGAQYTVKSVLPFSEDEAKSRGMVLSLRTVDVFVLFKDHNYYKVPVKDQYMTDPTVLAACASQGLVPPCVNEQNGQYSDDKCKDIGVRDKNLPMWGLTKFLCKQNPLDCEELRFVFQYAGNKFSNGAYGCGQDRRCPGGATELGGFALCVDQ